MGKERTTWDWQTEYREREQEATEPDKGPWGTAGEEEYPCFYSG